MTLLAPIPLEGGQMIWKNSSQIREEISTISWTSTGASSYGTLRAFPGSTFTAINNSNDDVTDLTTSRIGCVSNAGAWVIS
jgi:hypothetical protein